MPWTDEEWATFTAVLSRGFAARDPFTDADAAVYRLLLDDVDPAAALRSVREIVLEGQALRPKPGEIVERSRRDRGTPTFAEAYRLIFGPRGVLKARPAQRVFADAGARGRAEQQAALDRAASMHPLVAAFVERQGVDRLRGLELDDPDYGPVRRRDLEQAWNEHVEAFDGREVAALAAGAPRGQAGLHTFDPLAVLAPGRPAPVLGPATTEEVNPA